MPSLSTPCRRIEPSLEDWPAIDAAFAACPELPLGQAWRAAVEPRFRPAAARLGYREGALCVKVDLRDDDVFNPVSAFNEPAFLKGDVVEVFLHAPGQPCYCEVHSTPGGAVLQLRFYADRPRVPAPGSPIGAPVTRVLTRSVPGGWSVYFEIPWELPGARPGPGAQWRIAVCRYDYTRGVPGPVLSSTAAFGRLDFHQLEVWNHVIMS